MNTFLIHFVSLLTGEERGDDGGTFSFGQSKQAPCLTHIRLEETEERELEETTEKSETSETTEPEETG